MKRILSHIEETIELLSNVKVVIHSIEKEAIYYSTIIDDKHNPMKRAANMNGSFHVKNMGLVDISHELYRSISERWN